MMRKFLAVTVVFVMLFSVSCSRLDALIRIPTDEVFTDTHLDTNPDTKPDTKPDTAPNVRPETDETQKDTSEASMINGIDLAKFAVVYSDNDLDYSKRAALYIKNEILKRTGLNLAIVEESYKSNSEYEIVVGETSRDISAHLDADTDRTQFAILAEDKQIAIEGERFVIAAAAYFFIETYVPEDNFSAEIPKKISIHEPIVEKAENYIILIGDGMGLYQTLLFDILENNEAYSDGEDVFYGYYLPSIGFARTRSLSGTTDSAAAGTALSCGVKTINGYVGQDKDHKEVMSITELAASLGRSTAVMSTEPSTRATPASFFSHANDRSNSADILNDQSNMTKLYGTIINCDYNYYTESGIEQIETQVNDTLDKLDDNENGFFLMYEEAHIDKHCHNNDIENTHRAVIRFNQVIATVMEYAFYHPNTFVLITADHETGKLLPSGSGGYAYNTTEHSSHYVPVFAYGDGSELFNDTVIENIQIPQTIAAFMGKDDFGDQSEYKSLTK